MQEVLLKVNKRTEKPKVLRRIGIVPGVLYGDEFKEGIPVEFEKSAFSKIVNKHGSSAKIMVDFDKKKNLAIIKAVQKDPLSSEPLHVDLFMISQTHDLRMKIPLIFTGIAAIEKKEWVLQTYNAKIDISGKPNLIPESITVDVSNKNLRDSVTIKDLHLDEGIKIHNDENEIFASITEPKRKEEVEEIPEVEETTEEVTEE